MIPPVHIQLKGLTASGKTALLHELMIFLSERGFNVRAFDDNIGTTIYDNEFKREIFLENCFASKLKYEPENTLYITTHIERVDEGQFPTVQESRMRP